jgi:methylmalonyl-CoA mutase
MTASETLSLAGDFSPATHDDWRKLVDTVLKGAPFARLESRTYDGLTIEPLYERAAAAQPVPGRAPAAAWTLMQRVDHPDPAAANKQALEDLENGATGLVLVFAGSVSANGFGLEPSAATLKRVLDGVDLEAGIVIDLNLSPSSRHIVLDFAALLKERGVAPGTVDLRFSINPIGGFAAAGHSPKNWPDLAPYFAQMVGKLSGDGFRGPFAVADGRVIHNAGGSDAQELAFALASAVAYLRALETSGIALDQARDAIYFRLAADADQFLTMAKFRAARKLWARVEAACGLAAKPVTIAAETAWRMMTRRDAYVNMLRATIAVAAAGVGGADAITVLPHTAPLGLPDALARRVARNTQLLLLEESNLARVGDPAAGSGALEAMTQQLGAAAWSLFQEIEHAGGVWAALETGLVQRNAAAVCAARQKAVARGKDILTGTNAFPDLREAVPSPSGRCNHCGTAADSPRRAVRKAARHVRRDPHQGRHAAESFPRQSRDAGRIHHARKLRQELFRGRRHRGGVRRRRHLLRRHRLQGIGRRLGLPVLVGQSLRQSGGRGGASAQSRRRSPRLSHRPAGGARGRAARRRRAVIYLRGLRGPFDTDRRLRYSGAERVSAKADYA